ncbi:hypothetical protein PVAR5_4429 [Paecilomyces variotii No. 5]|uniref:Uncharacterized protein n=1 Tax=Byssochlamys spectabilis (strain No. 5 / NBRC 109023) TaxID=1356009 RepID=V5FUM3_BYSSN|nr:hypothetical protein PVAR5_4429 [Paecilomyces variotii No. 5]
MASHSQAVTGAPATGQANQPPVLPESAGTPWAQRDPLRPGAAGSESSLWIKEAAAFGVSRQLWGCAHCGSTATRFKGLRDHHSGRDGDRGSHRDHPFEDFTCCINNPHLQTPRPLIPEIREAAVRAINEGRVLPYTLQRFNDFYTGPPLPTYPPGLAPSGLVPPPAPVPSFASTAAPAPGPAYDPVFDPDLSGFDYPSGLDQHTFAADPFAAPFSAYPSDQAGSSAFDDFPSTVNADIFFGGADNLAQGESQTQGNIESDTGADNFQYQYPDPFGYQGYQEGNQGGGPSS